MAQLWGGRFTKETDKLVYNFNASLSFDSKLYKQDITGSMAHASMLAKQGIIEEQEKEEILKGLKSILEDIENKKLEFTEEYEDIHSFVEANLIDRCGDVGKKLHTGRSRNDQVALDMKMYVRDEIGEIDLLLKELLTSIYKIMSENVHICLDLHICRKHSRLRWHIILEHILKCSNVTEAVLQMRKRD